MQIPTRAANVRISGATDFANFRRVLVVAPHPDDESLGCGGLIATLGEFGRLVFVMFVTDGSASHRASPLWSREQLATLRKEEAAEALSRLGLTRAHRIFLDLEDANMPSRGSFPWGKALSDVEEVLSRFRPDLLIMPWRRDPHCDHRNSWSLMQDALLRSKQRPCRLEYAIWLDELGVPADWPQTSEAEPIDVDVANAVARKRHAIAAHRSQTTALISDDPNGFRLTDSTIARLTGPLERYWQSRDATD
jgi:LmbE family N-acetylglucosaminyl deacetylase